ncbi:MAG: lysozyme inhibitor LprI family protein [Methylococcales bacterium]|nr:lysozyme inhibitor LprI family protein [Methylococcales bacterium]
MKIKQFIGQFLLVIISTTAIAEDTQTCLGAAVTQTAMNQCTGIAYKEADAELNRVYKKIVVRYQDNALFLKKLKKAQLAWIKLRDADFELQYPHTDEANYYGSIFPMCASNYKTQLTLQRVVFLKQWLLGLKEGDLCSGSKKSQ